MDIKFASLAACVTVCTVLAGAPARTAAAELSVTVTGAAGAPVAGAVVVAEPAQGAARPRAGQKAVMDQRDLTYVPDVLVVQTGTSVDFPNSDQVRHQVYSFSKAKTFQLALYSGKAHAPVLFDKAGLVTLGCNIHDSMLGYIYVTDSPWYGRTDAAGTLQLRDLVPGEYTVHIWHALLDESGPQLRMQLNVGEGSAATANFHLRHALRPEQRHHGADKRWDDY